MKKPLYSTVFAATTVCLLLISSSDDDGVTGVNDQLAALSNLQVVEISSYSIHLT